VNQPDPPPPPSPQTPPLAGTPLSPEQVARAAQLMSFRADLQQRTSRVWATPALVAVNVIVFVLMAAKGVGPLSPSIDGLIAWGANYGPQTTSGQSWRLVTNVFVHIGLVHVAMNMIGLWQMGPLVERLLGNRGFLAVYFFSGVCGSLASVLWNPFVVSAGASGAVFGVYGGLLAFLLRHRGSIPAPVLQPLMRSTLIFVGLNVVFGFQVKGIDLAAHAGGFVGGFAATLAVGMPLHARLGRAALVREGALLALTVALVFVVPGRLPRVPDLQAELTAFDAVERTAIATYNDALKPGKRLSDVEIARAIDEKVLPPWQQFADRWQQVTRLPRLPSANKEQFTKIARYMDLRGRGWAMFSEALRTNDQKKADEAVALQKESERVFKSADTDADGKK